MRKVVITGLGAVCPIGNTAEEAWTNCKNGVSGVGPITQFDASEFLVQIAAEVKNFDPTLYMDKSEVRKRDLFEQFGMAAAKQALAQSGYEVTEANAARLGLLVSSSVGGLATIEENALIVKEKGPRRASPFTITMIMPNGASGMVGIDIGARGPALSVASACASGADSLGMAWHLIRAGVMDAALAGCADHSICPIGVASFDRIGAMSRENADYSMTPAPFDANRSGLVMGHGSGVLMLEGEDTAKARGAVILAELAGYAATSDANHITAPREDGAGSASAMVQALMAAGLNTTDVDYINAHGTATPLNDAAEAVAIRVALGEEFARRVPVSSTKSMTGHMMGATGAVEAVFGVLALRDQVAPPNIHYTTPDPAIGLNIVANTAREMALNVVMSNAFGFGGHNAVLVLRRYTG